MKTNFKLHYVALDVKLCSATNETDDYVITNVSQ